MKYWLVGIFLVLLAGGVWYYMREYQSETVPESVSVPPRAVVPEADSGDRQIRQQPDETDTPLPEKLPDPDPYLEELPLPDLADSDPVATELLAAFVGEAAVIQYFAQEDLVSRAVATVDALGSRQVPANIQVVQGPGGDFQAIADLQPEAIVRNEQGDPIPQFILDPANHRRYTAHVEMLEAFDTASLMTAYRSHYPLFQEAFRQLGYPDGDFDGRLREVIDELLATPEPAQPVQLNKPEAYYLYTAEELESLSAGQKILIRMGNENAARVKSKLEEIREAL